MAWLNKYEYICTQHAPNIFILMITPKPRIHGSLERYIIGKLGFQDDGTTICSFIKEALMEMKIRENKNILQDYLDHYDKMTDEERKEVQLKR
jgi:hypothetical protein